MVHIFCLDEGCRRVIHLDEREHWNFRGEVKCSVCGTVMEIEVKDGRPTSSVRARRSGEK